MPIWSITPWVGNEPSVVVRMQRPIFASCTRAPRGRSLTPNPLDSQPLGGAADRIVRSRFTQRSAGIAPKRYSAFCARPLGVT
jgi:hypothetical protein